MHVWLCKAVLNSSMLNLLNGWGNNMLGFLAQGFLVGFAYVAPIGMQNAYVIQSAVKLKRSEALTVAAITILFDVSLALACFFGVGLLVTKVAWLKLALLGFGSVAVAYIGWGLLKSQHEGIQETTLKESWAAIALMCFTVTWFNPQAIIDGTMLLSGFRAILDQTQGQAFIIGVALASISWFISITLTVNRFRERMTPQMLTWINRICGVVILCFAIKLGYHLFSEITLLK